MYSTDNRVYLIGYLTRGPVCRYKDLKTGKPRIVALSLGVKTHSLNKLGEKITLTQWINVVIHGYLAERSMETLKKGTRIALQGALEVRAFGEGEAKKFITEVKADTYSVLVPCTDDDGEPGGAQVVPPSTAAPAPVLTVTIPPAPAVVPAPDLFEGMERAWGPKPVDDENDSF